MRSFSSFSSLHVLPHISCTFCRYSSNVIPFFFFFISSSVLGTKWWCIYRIMNFRACNLVLFVCDLVSKPSKKLSLTFISGCRPLSPKILDFLLRAAESITCLNFLPIFSLLTFFPLFPKIRHDIVNKWRHYKGISLSVDRSIYVTIYSIY